MGGNVVTIETEIENKQIDTLLQVLFYDKNGWQITTQSWYNLRSWNFNTLEMAF